MKRVFKKKKKILKDNKGIITISFLLVLTIILVFILSFFGLAMTLAHISVSQYMSYSSARNFSLGGSSYERQMQVTKDHYKALRKSFFKPTAHTGAEGDWFKIQEDLTTTTTVDGLPKEPFGDPGGYSNDPNRHKALAHEFYGVTISFQSFIARFEIPFLVEESEVAGDMRISSFLGREPSEEECKEFNRSRLNRIQSFYQIDGEISADSSEGEGDNGC